MTTAISIHVGVGAVDPKAYASSDGHLLASETDARAMHALAVANGFAAQPILLTRDATLPNLRAQLFAARDTLVAGDRLLVTFAGHGTSRESPTRPGHRDEAWCLYDGLFLDDTVNRFLCMLAPGVRVLVVSDSCFSGTITELPGGAHPRFLPAAAAAHAWRHAVSLPEPITESASSGGEHPRCSVLLLAASRENEAAVEGEHHGRFTEALLRVWDDGRFAGTHDDFIAQIAARTPNQTPQLFARGPLDGAFLRSRPFRPIDEAGTESVARLQGEPADPPGGRTVARVRLPIQITVSVGPVTVTVDHGASPAEAPTAAPVGRVATEPAASAGPSKRDAIRTFLTAGHLPTAVTDVTESPDSADVPVDEAWLAAIEERRRRLAEHPAAELAKYRAFYSDPDLTLGQATALLDTIALAIARPAAFYDQLVAPVAPVEEGVLGTLGALAGCVHKIPRWFPRRAPSPSQRDDLARLRARYQLDPDLDLNPNDHDFELCDPRWWPLLLEYVEEKTQRWPDGLATFRRHSPGATFVYDESARAAPHVALLADFGTGAYHARHIARQLERHAYPFVFHLGDVYYGGTAAEFAERYTRPLAPVMAAGSQLYSLPENHELYGEGHAYLAFVDAQRAAGHTRQEGSYFCVRFHRHQLIALDANWNGRRRFRDRGCRDWLDHVVATGGGRTTILVTGCAPWVYGDADPRSLLDELRPWVDRGAFDLWFWGDDHYAAIFERDRARADVIGSCIGHAGYPGALERDGKPSYVAPRWVETAPRFPPIAPLRTDLGNNGWCEATLLPDGGVELLYVDWLGAKRYQVRFDRFDDGPRHTLRDVLGHAFDATRSDLHTPR